MFEELRGLRVEAVEALRCVGRNCSAMRKRMRCENRLSASGERGE